MVFLSSELTEPPTDLTIPSDLLPELLSEVLPDQLVPLDSASSDAPLQTEETQVDTEKIWRIMRFLREQRVSLFTIVRAVLNTEEFSGYAVSFKRALYGNEGTQTLHVILEHGRRRKFDFLPYVISDLRRQMKSLCKLDWFAKANLYELDSLKDADMPDPDTTLQSVEKTSPGLLSLLRSLTQRTKKDNRRRSTELLTLLSILSHARRKKQSNAMQLKIGLHLHASGTRRHVIDLLQKMGVCCSYRVILRNVKELSNVARERIVAIAKRPSIVTAYDNFEYTMGVRQQRVHDNSTFYSVTTGLAFEGRDIPPEGLTQSMLNPGFKLTIRDLIKTGAFETDDIDFQFSKYAVYETLRLVFGNKVEDIYSKKGAAAPTMPIIDRLEPFRTEYRPLRFMDINESTNSGNIAILTDISSRQYKWDESHGFGKKLHIFYGDQKTVARIRSVKQRRRESRNVFDRFGWVLPIPALFHVKMLWVRMIHKHHYMEKHRASPSTLAYVREVLGRKRVQTDKADFFALEELILHTFHGKILAALFAKLRDKYQWLDPRRISPPCEDQWDELFKVLDFNTLEDCMDAVVRDIMSGEIDPESHSEYMNTLHFIMLARGYLMLKLGIRHGDLGLIKRAIGFAVLFFNGSRHRNYAYEMLYLYRLIATEAADPILQRAILANSLVNYSGCSDTFFETDRFVENLNGHMKRILNERRGPSITLQDLFEYSAINAPLFHRLRTTLWKTFGVKVNTASPYKSASEDIRVVAERSYFSLLKENCPLHETKRVPILPDAALTNLRKNIKRLNEDEFEEVIGTGDDDDPDLFFSSVSREEEDTMDCLHV